MLRSARTGARCRPGGQGQRRRRVRRAAGSGGAGPAGARHAGRVLGRRCAGDAGPHARRSGRSVPRADPALRPRASPTAAASRCVEAYRALGARDCVPIYNALDPEHALSGRARAALRRRPGLPGQPAAGPRGARRGVLPAGRAQLPDRTFLLGGSGWGDKPMPANVHVPRPRLHRRPQRVQLHAARGAEHQPREHGALRLLAGHARVRSGRRGGLPDHRRLGRPRACSSSPAEMLVAQDGDEVAEHVRALDAGQARADRPGAYRRVLAEHTYAHRAAQLESAAAKASAQPQASRHERRAAHRHPRPVDHLVLGQRPRHHLPRPGARAGAARPRRAVPRARRALVRRATATCRARLTAAPALRQPGRTARRVRAPSARGRPGDRRLLRARRRRGRRLGAARGAAASTAFYDIDTPVTLAKLARGEYEYLRPTQIAGYDLYLSFTGGPTLRPAGATSSARRARARCIARSIRSCTSPSRAQLLGPGLHGHLQRRPAADAGTPAAASPRASWPEAPVRRRRAAVSGRASPGRRTSSVPQHLPPGEHRAFYNRQRFTLNVTRADMIRAGWSPSVRLFEAAACGTPIISDRWAGPRDAAGAAAARSCWLDTRGRGPGDAAAIGRGRAPAHGDRARAPHPGRTHRRAPRRAAGRATPSTCNRSRAR